MNYYNRHLGDFAKATAHLTPLEVGVYDLILDAYYDRERPLSEQEAIRFARARSSDEVAAVKSVLHQFFLEENGVFSQTRVEVELSAFHKRQKINRKLGKLGGLAKGKRFAKRTASERLASQSPIANSQEPTSLRSDRVRASKQCPPSFVVDTGLQAWAAGEGISQEVLQRETQKFMDYTFAAAKADWPATWRNWMRKAGEVKHKNGRTTGNREVLKSLMEKHHAEK